MRFVLTIEDMDNEAFEESNGAEVARILRKLGERTLLAAQLQPGDAGILLDYNGNRVGGWRVKD